MKNVSSSSSSSHHTYNTFPFVPRERMRVLVIDVETNGLPVSYVSRKKQTGFTNLRLLNERRFDECRAIEVAMMLAEFEDGVCTILHEWSALVSQNVQITNSDIHGITEQNVLDTGVHMDAVLEELSKHLDFVDYVVAHNADFDLQVMASECKRHGWPSLLQRLDDKPVVCTMLRAFKQLKLMKWPKLVDLYKRLCFEEATNAHRALADCRMCMACFEKLGVNN